jgi:thiol-disulfide isomerase/thioredoxin
MRPLLAAAVLTFAAGAAAAAPPDRPASSVTTIDRAGYAALLSSLQGRAVVVNMWATWCDPCRAEFPGFVKLHQKMGPRGVEVVGISMDAPSSLESAVLPFLRKHGAEFRVYIKQVAASESDDDFINGVDPKWSGALPATFVYDKAGKLVKSFTGPLNYHQLEKAVSPLVEK